MWANKFYDMAYCKTWTGFVKHGFVKRVFVEGKWNCQTVDLFTFLSVPF